MARELTRKQRRFVTAYVETEIGVKAAFAAYSTKDYATANAIAVENLQKPSIRAEVEKALVARNLGPERWTEVLDNAVSAESELVSGPGHIAKQPDHRTRLNAVDLAARLSDAYPREPAARHEHRHLHLESNEPIEVMRFRVIHGRAPTERDMKELMPAFSEADET